MRAWFAVLLVGCAADPFVPVQPPPAPLPECSQMQMLADHFGTATLSSSWQATPSAPTTTFTTGDGLAIAFFEPGDATIAATRYYDLREGEFSAGVDAAAGRVELELVAAGDSLDALSMVRDAGTLRFATDVDGKHTDLAEIPYDPVAYRFWRIADTGTAIVWSTSADGATFVSRYAIPTFAWVTYMKPILSVHADTPLTATLRDVNGGIAYGHACAAAELVDDFSGPAIADHWQWSAQNGSLSPQDGSLEVYYPPRAQQAAIQLASSTIYDLNGAAFAFELPVAIPHSAGVYITIATLTGESVELRESGGGFGVLQSPQVLPTSVGAYDPAADRWLRARESGRSVFFETSPDGVTYSTLGRSQPMTGLDRASISFLFNGAGNDYENPLVITLDNFNVVP